MRHALLSAAVLGLAITAVLSAEETRQPAGGAAPARPAGLRAGAAAVDITPKVFPINMPGGFSANMAESAHDPLTARALAFDDGATAAVVVVVDNLGVSAEVCDEARALAAARCPVAPDRIMVCSTHTHSAPSSNVKSGSEAGMAYRKVIVAGIADAVVKAHAALRPAAVGAAAHPLPDEVFNRRWYLKPGKMKPNPFGQMDTVKMNPPTDAETLDRPAGPTDPDLTVLSVQDARTRRPLALWASYCLHYVGGTPRAQVSADYFGEFCRLMPSRVRGDEAFVAMLANGTSGDINNIPFLVTRPPREPFEQCRLIAAKAADTAWLALRKIETHSADAKVAVVLRPITLKLRCPTPEQVAAAKAVLAVKDPDEIARLPGLAQHYAGAVVGLAEAARSTPTLTVPLQVLRVGQFAICAIPFETFVEIGLEIKKRSPLPRTVVTGVSNGYNGYLPTPEQHKLGGYETWFGTSKVQEDASVLITSQILEMLAEAAK